VLSFLKDFRKEVGKLENVTLDAKPPQFWHSVGNFAINRIISGSYSRGIPQGRVTAFVGPSDSGKSYILTNTMACAQQLDKAFILAIDSENALDYNYLHRVGVNTDPDHFQACGVVTVQDVVKVVSEFIDGYIKAYGKYNKDAPKVLVAIDSLSMLLTESENEHFEKGDQKGDQGQQAKQIKHFLKTMTSRMKMTNMSLACTAHVYAADPLKGEGMYSVTPALRYACSQIVLITKLRLKDEEVNKYTKEKEILGIRLKAETFKSRFSKIGSKVTVEVPYDRGMSQYSGLLERLLEDEIITNPSVGWYMVSVDGVEKKFRAKELEDPDSAKAIVDICMRHPIIAERDALFGDFVDLDETHELMDDSANKTGTAA
jgi:RecA/RadA recombinase